MVSKRQKAPQTKNARLDLARVMGKNSSSRDNSTLHEECGVVGAYSFKKNGDVAPLLYRALINLQHRGQDSAGMATFNGQKITNHRELGLVGSVFNPEVLAKLAGSMGIAHVRYPTIGAGGPEDAQPFCVSYPMRGIALAHNGNIANYGTLRAFMESKGHQLTSTCDSDLILNLWCRHLQDAGLDLFKSTASLMKDLDGSYSVCAITGNGEFVVFRDPKAIRPLCWGQTKDYIMFASESTALDINDIPLMGDVEPGACLVISSKGIVKKIVAPGQGRSHCMFEYVYFSRPDSVQEGALIYNVRMELGRRLAKAAPVDADIVVPV
ncbi:MAG: class II glutamine amidotransferase, partial [Candidatus Micrarchaeota archaeon]|nr:class II glutamine amidotransferase [Candidatus Micrarchaeota archaeon]